MEVGVNVPWLGGAYGHDLGPNSHLSGWPVAFERDSVQRLLDQLLAFDVKLVRFWLCERAEGLVWNDSLIVTGVHGRFLENLHCLVQLLLARGQRGYWTLLDANSVYRNTDVITYRLMTSAPDAEQFCASALPAILEVLRPAAWAIDVCNEPEALIPGKEGNSSPFGVDSATLIDPLRRISAQVKSDVPSAKVGIGSGYTEGRTLRDNELLTGFVAGLDLADYHCYSRDPRHRGALATPGLSKHPWVIGELGYELPESMRQSRPAWLEKQKEVAHRLHVLAGFGYDAAFLWYMTDTCSPDATSLVLNGEAGWALHAARSLNRARPQGGVPVA